MWSFRKPSVPEPLSFLRTSWSTDPFALCSYSYLAPGPLGTSVRSQLAAPVGRLHFAGEATATQTPSTTQGAVESGQRAAMEIADSAPPNASVVVVGAGFAGITCARSLTDKGFQVTVLEGRSRVGGRAWTRWLSGVPADLGASWIHGVTGNPMTELLDGSGGRRYRFNYGRTWGGDQAALKKLPRYAKKFENVEDPDTTAMSAVFPQPLPADLEYACNTYYSQDFGADVDQLAVAAHDEVRTIRGGDVLLPDGYDKLLAQARGDLPVRTEAIVTTIRRTASDVSVTLENRETISADYAVVTVPIGVLKAGSISFDPPLPAPKQRAIEAMGAGLLDKLWLEFPTVFWNRRPDVLLWHDRTTPGRWSVWVNGHRAFGRPVLLGFNGGRRAYELAHASDEEVLASGMAALRQMHAG